MNELTKSPMKYKIGGMFVPVRNLERAREWYGRILGLGEGEVHFGHLFVPEMEGSTQLIMDTMPRWRNEAGDIYPYHSPSLQFVTDDVHSSFEYMKTQEVELVTEIEDNFYFVIRDLDGNLLMICQE